MDNNPISIIAFSLSGLLFTAIMALCCRGVAAAYERREDRNEGSIPSDEEFASLSIPLASRESEQSVTSAESGVSSSEQETGGFASAVTTRRNSSETELNV